MIGLDWWNRDSLLNYDVTIIFCEAYFCEHIVIPFSNYFLVPLLSTDLPERICIATLKDLRVRLCGVTALMPRTAKKTFRQAFPGNAGIADVAVELPITARASQCSAVFQVISYIRHRHRYI